MATKEKYEGLTFSQLITKIAKSRYWDLPTMLAEAFKKIQTLIDDIPSGDSRPYKVYTALLTQSGTDAPVATVLENTLGDIVWSRDDTGEYYGTLVGAFTENKTFLNITPVEFSHLIGGKRNSDNDVYVSSGQVSYNDGFSNAVVSIEIRVYN